MVTPDDGTRPSVPDAAAGAPAPPAVPPRPDLPPAQNAAPSPPVAPSPAGPEAAEVPPSGDAPAPREAAEVLNDMIAEATSSERVINTGSEKTDGLDKCPRCGSTEIVYSFTTFSLVCAFCRHSWNEPGADETHGFGGDSSLINGLVIGSGSRNITAEAHTITIKCQGCGAEIVIETRNSLNSRCHWCRQVLSVREQIPNGLIPDSLLPFTVTHEQAVESIRKFAGSRRLFAKRGFKRGFVPENIVGVYMPYMSVDANLATKLYGKAEILTRKYTITVGSGKSQHQEIRYDADVYDIEVSYDYTVDDLITESSSGRADMTSDRNTNNVINAILPFDIQNAVVYNSHYLTNFTSERRDLDVADMAPKIEGDFLSIARGHAGPAIYRYDRGVRWEHEGVKVKGARWQSVYLPVWLYSHHDNGVVHYIAVNGRNGKTMGSIPVSQPKLIAFSGFLATAVTVLGFFMLVLR